MVQDYPQDTLTVHNWYVLQFSYLISINRLQALWFHPPTVVHGGYGAVLAADYHLGTAKTGPCPRIPCTTGPLFSGCCPKPESAPR